jgi:uncharacterized protein YbjT (DUF2867 family)
MTRTVLVTGATGTLGRQVVSAAVAAGHRVAALSRRHHADQPGVHWQVADLLSGAGIDSAVNGVDVILHCATQATGGKDLISAKNLLGAAGRAGVGHIVYVSIVGVDRIRLPYYSTKLRVEQAVASSGLGYTILRATQFHDLIAATFSAQRFSPVLLALRDVRFQPIDTRDVAASLIGAADAGPAGRVPDIGGPEIRSHASLGRAYRAWRGARRPVISVPLPGRLVAGYRAGANLAPDNSVGTIRFEDYLSRS